MRSLITEMMPDPLVDRDRHVQVASQGEDADADADADGGGRDYNRARQHEARESHSRLQHRHTGGERHEAEPSSKQLRTLPTE
jgi:hypothetical protein